MNTVIGNPLPRVEDARLLTGQGKYIDDLGTPGNTAQAAIVRSSYPHAYIQSIDITEALSVPGVKGVITGKDVQTYLNPFSVGVSTPVKYYPIAIDKVRYVGEPVAVVIAKNRYIAEDAAELVKVKYETLEPIVDIEKSIEEDAPILHENVGSNIANHRNFHYGNVDQAFNDADRIIKHKFNFPKYTATPIETYGIIAQYESSSDQYTIQANFHGPFIIQSVMAGALKIPSNRLRIIVPKDIGGSYGIKAGTFPYMVLCAVASRIIGCPVKWIEDRQEHLSASSSGTDRVTYIEAAVKEDGKVLGLKMKMIDNVGAYIRAPEPACLYRTHANSTGAYDIPNLMIDGYVVMTNKLPTGLIRGYGGQELYFPLERIMQMIAFDLGLDPAEVIQKNLIKAEQFPYHTASGGIYDSGDYEKAFHLALDTGKYQEFRQKQEEARRKGKIFGVGLACIVEPSGSNMGYITIALTPEERAASLPKSGASEAATISMDPMGSVNVRISTTPSGQGHETVAAQIVSDVLQIPTEQINVVAELDTSTSAWSIASGSYSSRFASLGSSAVYYAAHKVREKILKIAAHHLQVAEDDLTIENASIYSKADPSKKYSVKRAAGSAHWNPMSLPEGMEPGIYETYFYTAKKAEAPDENDLINSSVTYGFVADLVTVEIDPETGEVNILDYITIHDAGKLLNPLIVDGQIFGGLVHGLGGALYEELAYDEKGQFLTGSFMDYLVPTAPEIPNITIKHIESPSPVTPLGAKGLGEGNTMSAPVAIANAVSDALKPYQITIDSLPLSPNKIWNLLSEQKVTNS
ncbi:xanthine dehydrogenase family protein molybdopterin-binding subunit [Peribacillus cavernae]|uniref:Xanthine dehydrogenase family protein molybdopterin-binding subunit n=1 Tax=Peribacillus cavernae TaxID=1674310 RepID=A0A3S0U603_9BACI|nr:xanthine dehydrogenase family protein molybdopterin-binding subunit [Peribacillus cavernae]MDQ0218704.1 2-furoyl-CoA dehydrogenase large subunit [Peribacillus cavernae]RUQ30921.1 xanthine dehydrogenase family protein molybdopterin-binding subunit [Peribacillus cavernae]